MHHVAQMLEKHPHTTASDALARCIGECLVCAQTCTSYADACLAEERVPDLVRCVRLDLDCADICAATASVLTRQTAFDAQLSRSPLETCAEACRTCATECERHAEHHEHCRLCAEACRRCEQAVRDLVSSIA